MTEPSRWGAWPRDWAVLCESGLTADLLPVVSDPNAKIAELSKLKTLGKVPSRLNSSGEVVGVAAWTRVKATDHQIKLWMAHPSHGICIQTRRLRAIDIDIKDPEVAGRVEASAVAALGPMPVRRRADSGKRLMAVVCDAPMTKRVIRTAHGNVELLADGQQFIACGTHPDGARYEWDGPGVDPMEGAPYRWPETTLAELDAWWSALATEYEVESTEERRGIVPVVPREAAAGWGDPMVPWLAENGHVKRYDRDGRVYITCPFEDGHTAGAGDDTSTCYFPAGVGGFSQGHFRCLHASCSGRSDQDFMDELGLGVATEFEPAAPPAPIAMAEGALAGFEDQGAWPAFARRKDGRILPTAGNAQAASLRPDIIGIRAGYDQFKDVVMIAYKGDEAWRPINDNDYFQARVAFERAGFDAPGKELVRDAILWSAQHHQFDSLTQWVEGLAWDGVPRVEGFLQTYCGVEPSAYATACSRYIWTALAARALSPGCKVDMVPVLIGDQGIRKTTLVAALAPEPTGYVEVNLERLDDDTARSLRGKVVAELAELRGLRGRDAESIKAWISRTHEEWTPKYREYAVRFPRRCLLIGTANEPEFLDDSSGERRWLPITVPGLIDTDAIAADRDQLWAEGAALFKGDGVAWRDAETLAVEVHADFKVADPWDDAVRQWLASGAAGDFGETPEADAWGRVKISLEAVAQGALNLDARAMTIGQTRRLGACLRKAGAERSTQRLGGRPRKVWLYAPPGDIC